MYTPQLQNDPIYSLPHLYYSGLTISVASNTVIAIAPGQARDSMNNIDMPVGFANLEGVTNPGSFYPQTAHYGPIPGLVETTPVQYSGYPVPYTSQPLYINTAVVGANGLDKGTLAASSFYTIWLIGDSRNINPVAGIISLYSNAFPLLPSGYDSYVLMGYVQTNSSIHFVAADVLNYKNAGVYYLQPAVSVLSGGNATTFTAIDCSGALSDNLFSIVFMICTFIPAAVGDYFQLRPTGSSATTGLLTVPGVAAGIAQTNYVQTIAGVASSKAEVDYLVSSSSDSLSISVYGYSYTTT